MYQQQYAMKGESDRLQVTLPGVWEAVGQCYVKTYRNTDSFLEAQLMPSGRIRIQAKISGLFGGVIKAVQSVDERHVSLNDDQAIRVAVTALEAALKSGRFFKETQEI